MSSVTLVVSSPLVLLALAPLLAAGALPSSASTSAVLALLLLFFISTLSSCAVLLAQAVLSLHAPAPGRELDLLLDQLLERLQFVWPPFVLLPPRCATTTIKLG